jgi:RHH-type transcriptional regulator, proline utilization regulon repressor / proline dehydrogenase / delta 1-pyrroline-5-carboxylate dehydrogenase
MLFSNSVPKFDAQRAAIFAANYRDETDCVTELLTQLPSLKLDAIQQRAFDLAHCVRNSRLHQGGLDAFLAEYDLSSQEGIALMCLAEAFLRIPDQRTVDKLIQDKLTSIDWQAHQHKSHSWSVYAATWGLQLSGKILTAVTEGWTKYLRAFLQRSSAPIIRQVIKRAMNLLSHEFIMGETIEKALKRARKLPKYCFSYDMLGEAACTQEDAARYLQAYQHAIEQIASSGLTNCGISVKLSALHPRYEYRQKDLVVPELVNILKNLALQAQANNIQLTVDAEESERLEISLEIIEQVFCDPQLTEPYFGVAVQAYLKRAPEVIDWIIALAYKQNKRMNVRLVKGAYWELEIKNAQIKGLKNYPVFTRHAATDVNYLVCAGKMARHPKAIYAQFATHNAYTVAAILELMEGQDFEFQGLHGMAYTLYDHLLEKNPQIRCRIYAPVPQGEPKNLLSYLMRRLMEGKTYTSFVNKIVNAQIPIENIIKDPAEYLRAQSSIPHPSIPLPSEMFLDRKNSDGIDLTDPLQLIDLDAAMQEALARSWRSAPIVDGILLSGSAQSVYGPDPKQEIGTVVMATVDQLEQVLTSLQAGFLSWRDCDVLRRAALLNRAADLLQQRMPQWLALLVREGGKTIGDALSEVREAIDFCRYYAQQACISLQPKTLPGPTGELNQLTMHGRGIIVCISPWNFPLAIFLGQVTAALAAGNCVIAKPASQTTLIACAAVQLLHEAGIPTSALAFLPGPGHILGSVLLHDERIAGVVFTGSTETAKQIDRDLAQRPGPIVPLIAETGGQNAMIVDSSALLEQVVADVLISAFNSAGQRCSALRVLWIQDEIAETLISLLCGAMAQLNIGDPGLLATDIGPVIDAKAKKMLLEHVARMKQEARLLYQVPLPEESNYIGPCLFELNDIKQLTYEVFGPMLHVLRYRSEELPKVVSTINALGYGLTLGIASRIQSTIDFITQHAKVGNQYVNRTMIGAVVGVQPFGGEGLSGTGPKAGGPHYLTRLCVERCISVNTTAFGGNAQLLALED